MLQAADTRSKGHPMSTIGYTIPDTLNVHNRLTKKDIDLFTNRVYMRTQHNKLLFLLMVLRSAPIRWFQKYVTILNIDVFVIGLVIRFVVAKFAIEFDTCSIFLILVEY